MESRVLSISEVTAAVKRALEESFDPLWVEGEISNFHLHSSGHMYFTLKDAAAQLRCVMFRGANTKLRFVPGDGQLVHAHGALGVYERQGQYQLLVDAMAPAGIGALQKAFEALKKRLEAEGLFDPARKKALPRYPERIGIITSARGAAIHDLLTVLRRRWRGVSVVVRPVPVQGDGAAEEIARAIGEMNAFGAVDVLIVGRGGGSVEDLWAFNEEVVARAIHGSSVPVISAVGHEIDVTMADYVADMRAPTPTGAAEIAVRDAHEEAASLRHVAARLERLLRHRLSEATGAVGSLVSSYGMRRTPDRIAQGLQRLDETSSAIATAWRVAARRERERARGLELRLGLLHPRAVLGRGYCICRREAGGVIVTDAASIAAGDGIRLEFARGGASARVTAREDGDVSAT